MTERRYLDSRPLLAAVLFGLISGGSWEVGSVLPAVTE